MGVQLRLRRIRTFNSSTVYTVSSGKRMVNITLVSALIDLGTNVANLATNLVNMISENKAKQRELRNSYVSGVSALIARGGETLTNIIASSVSAKPDRDVIVLDENNHEVEIVKEAANGQ